MGLRGFGMRLPGDSTKPSEFEEKIVDTTGVKTTPLAALAPSVQDFFRSLTADKKKMN